MVEKYLYFYICIFFMSLEEFLTDCKSKGSIPLSYRSETVTLKGKQIVEYVNQKYAKALNRTKYERPDAGRVEDEY